MFLDQFLILSRPKEMIGLQTILGTLKIMHCLACGCLEKPYRALRSTIKNCSIRTKASGLDSVSYPCHQARLKR